VLPPDDALAAVALHPEVVLGVLLAQAPSAGVVGIVHPDPGLLIPRYHPLTVFSLVLIHPFNRL